MEHGTKALRVARIWEKAREHATNAVIGGLILVLTGFTPEHWVAEVFHKLHLPADALSVWPASLDLRLVIVSIGIAIMIGDTLWRRHRAPAPAAVSVDDIANTRSGPQSIAAMPKIDLAAELPLPSKPSIVVLPFDNLSKDPSEDYFTDGMTEEITTVLARVTWLFVIARNSAFTYKGRAVDIKQVGRELGVRYVLEGSVRRDGDRVRITGQLLDAETGTHLWADRFDGAMEEIFELQDNIASSIVGAIEPQMRSAEVRRAVSKPTASPQAYDHFLRALAAFYQLTRESLETTISECRRAIELDRSYSSSYALAAWCYAWRDNLMWTKDQEAERGEAIRYARLAVEYGSDDPNALWMAGHTLAYCNAANEEGARIIDRALELNPNSASAWAMSGWARCYIGQGKTAIGHFNRALRLSPRDPLGHTFKSGMALAYITDENYGEALKWANQALAEQPKFSASLRMKAAALGMLGRIDEATEVVQILLAEQPHLTLESMSFLRWRKSSTTLMEGLRRAGIPER